MRHPSDRLLVLCVAVLVLIPLTLSAQTVPAHLAAARDLVSRVPLDRTRYEHGQGTVDFGVNASSYTDCSGLIDHLLMHAYGYTAADFTRWFGSRRPSAKRYFDAVAEQTGFLHLDKVTDLQPGDIIVVKYLARTDNTGHVMIVDARPQKRGGRPNAHGEAWLVPVIDSSESGHGPSDTRHKQGPDGKDKDGIGHGVLRVFTDSGAHVTGFTWSELSTSAFRGPDEEPVALGRLMAGFKP